MADDGFGPVPHDLSVESTTEPPREPDWHSPRHRAARILVRCTAVAWLLLVTSQVLGSYFGTGLTETATQLMITVGSALVAATAAYLVRRVEKPPDPALENNVGLWLSITLGGMLLIMAIGPIARVAVSFVEGEQTPALGTNALNLLSVMFGGAIGALGAYLGLRNEGGSHDDDCEDHD